MIAKTFEKDLYRGLKTALSLMQLRLKKSSQRFRSDEFLRIYLKYRFGAERLAQG